VIWQLSCGFVGRGRGRILDRRAPVLAVADPCNWHACGTNLSRRQSATTVSASTDQARVCLAAPPPAPVTSSGVVGQSFHGKRSGTRLRRPLRLRQYSQVTGTSPSGTLFDSPQMGHKLPGDSAREDGPHQP
jgi:hypothetical protein